MLLVAADVVGRTMAGPGMRVVSIAEQLVSVADVTLAVGIEGSEPASLAGRGFTVVEYGDRDELISLIEKSDVAFCQLIDEYVVRRGLAAGCRFIFDLYNALPAEAIGAERIGGFDTQPQMDDVFTGVLRFFRFCMRAGSYFVTSNERQRDFWIGYMLASEGLLPSELRGRHAGEVIGLLPFGMEEAEPVARRHGIRGRFGINDESLVLLWAGGIWDWFDAETPIRAVAELRDHVPAPHLVFYGTTHPNSLVGQPPAVQRARDLAADLGVLDDRVHFIEGWVPASERAEYLLDADIVVSGHKESFETRYAFRTRILDHFWAKLPSIVSEGDWFAEYISDNNLGLVTAYGDVSATRDAIVALSDPARRAQIAANVLAIRADWRWSATARQLRAVVSDWETTLPHRDRAIEEARAAVASQTENETVVATPVDDRSRLRLAASASPLGAVYRTVKRTFRR